MSNQIEDEYILSNHTYFLAPIKLEDGKMFMWYSICSAHRSHDTECNMCQAGSWCRIRRVRSQEEIDQFGDPFDEYADG